MAGRPLCKNTLHVGPGQLTNGGSQCQYTFRTEGPLPLRSRVNWCTADGLVAATMAGQRQQPERATVPCEACPPVLGSTWPTRNPSRVPTAIYIAVDNYSHLPFYVRSATTRCEGVILAGKGDRLGTASTGTVTMTTAPAHPHANLMSSRLRLVHIHPPAQNSHWIAEH